MLQRNSDGGRLADHCVPQQPKMNRLATRQRLFILSLIFLTALGVRLINWYGSRDKVSAVQTSVALNYKYQAKLIRENGLASLYDASSSTSNPDLLGHPIGYPILLSLIYRAASESDRATQLLQMMLDSLAAVVLCLIAFELFPTPVGIIAGLMAAFAPQLAGIPFCFCPIRWQRCQSYWRCFSLFKLATARRGQACESFVQQRTCSCSWQRAR